MIRLLAIVPLVFAAGSAMAQDDASTGVASCDAFVAAYAQCAASPGVSADARAAITSGVANLRQSLREGARNESARATLGQQCARGHAQVREQMMAAFKCDFPAPSGQVVADVAPAPAPKPPAPPKVDPEAQVAAKANAYTKVQNSLVDHGTAKQLSEHVSQNERVLKLGTKLGANAFYQFPVTDFQSLIDDLKEAMALPGALPEVDGPAQRLLDAMQAVDPVIKTLSRYQVTRAFKDDGFKLAREQQGPLVAGMRGVIAAQAQFSDALFERRMKLDEARLAAMPPGSLPQALLGTSLATRRLVRQYDRLDSKTPLEPFRASLSAVMDANKALSASLDQMSPKADSYCASYAEDVDTLVGKARDMADDYKAKRGVSQSSGYFADAYNSSIRTYGNCRRDEPRAR